MAGWGVHKERGERGAMGRGSQNNAAKSFSVIINNSS